MTMVGPSAKRGTVSDLRGAAAIRGPVSVLEDPPGQRARRMRRVGRVVGVLFLLWILVLVLGGLVLIPAANVPLGGALSPSSGPPVLPRDLVPAQPAADDLVVARPPHETVGKAGGAAAPTRHVTSGREPSRTSAKTQSPPTSGRVTRPSHGVAAAPPAPAASPGSKATTPATSGTPSGQGAAPTPGSPGKPTGHTTPSGPTTTPGNSAAAPGLTTAPGDSGSAPGQTTTSGNSTTAPGRTTIAPGNDGAGTTTTPPPPR